jgi:hypothetical protein
VAALKALIRYFSYVFHGLLALSLLAISGLAWMTGENLHLGMLPWTGATLTYIVFFASLFGLISVALSIRRSWRVLFFLWSLAVLVLLVKGYVFTGYHLSPGEPLKAAGLTLASAIAVIGAWLAIWLDGDRRGRY